MTDSKSGGQQAAERGAYVACLFDREKLDEIRSLGREEDAICESWLRELGLIGPDQPD